MSQENGPKGDQSVEISKGIENQQKGSRPISRLRSSLRQRYNSIVVALALNLPSCRRRDEDIIRELPPPLPPEIKTVKKDRSDDISACGDEHFDLELVQQVVVPEEHQFDDELFRVPLDDLDLRPLVLPPRYGYDFICITDCDPNLTVHSDPEYVEMDCGSCDGSDEEKPTSLAEDLDCDPNPSIYSDMGDEENFYGSCDGEDDDSEPCDSDDNE